MSEIDLHVHSNASDGSMSPTEVVKHAFESGLKGIALTDHDSGRGIHEALLAAALLPEDFFVIPGTEISCECNDEALGIKDTELHILGYYINPDTPSFISSTDEIIRRREERNEAMAANFTKNGMPMTVEDLRDKPDTIITRGHFASFLTKKGYVKTMDEAFKKYLYKDSPFYVRREFISPKEAIKIITDAGGVPVLAHPLLYKLNNQQLDGLLDLLISYGLKGLEAIYTLNTGLSEGDMKGLARKKGLFITGGSDFHGANKPKTQIGTGFGNLSIPLSLLTGLKQARDKRKEIP